MALLNFPPAPINGQLFPSTPLPGQTQYEWSEANGTWALLGPATTVVPGCYGDTANVAAICVDAQGRITSAVNVPITDGGTVTSITAGTGLTGGTITSSGTIALNSTYMASTYLTLTGGNMTGNIVFVSGQVVNGGGF